MSPSFFKGPSLFLLPAQLPVGRHGEQELWPRALGIWTLAQIFIPDLSLLHVLYSSFFPSIIYTAKEAKMGSPPRLAHRPSQAMHCDKAPVFLVSTCPLTHISLLLQIPVFFVLFHYVLLKYTSKCKFSSSHWSVECTVLWPQTLGFCMDALIFSNW